ncbi:MAG: thiamine-phosphate kinase [Bacteroides sp.]|nr:thiamine-phosphate kinase [Bacteroides sp.]
MSQQETEISTLGEFGLIDRLTKDFPLRNSSSLLGVGDDAAVLDLSEGETLVTTDLLLEGIHFDLRYVPLKHLGYKAAIVNFSDIYAMNGTPKQITVSIGVSSRFSVEHIEELYSGIRLACEIYGVDLVGGDTSASVTGLVISITCIGTAKKEDVVKRSGAKPTDIICVSGDLGAAYMGLQLLERENRVAAKAAPGFQPDFMGKEYLLERQLKPEARKDIIELLAQNGIRPTAMMDVSDGLSSELLHICKASGVGCRVYEDRIPIDYQTAVMAEEFNMNLVMTAMNGGEDYELLFTVPLSDNEKIEKLKGVTMIGYITKPELGAAMVTRDGSEIELRAQGWNAFNPSVNSPMASSTEQIEDNVNPDPDDKQIVEQDKKEEAES